MPFPTHLPRSTDHKDCYYCQPVTSNSSYPPHLHLFTSVQTRTYLQHWGQTQAKEEKQDLDLSAIKLLVKI